MPRLSAPAPSKSAGRTRAGTVSALRRQEIVQAAIKVFSRKGFEAARAEDIAHTARIAKGTLYLYFRSKEALYSAAIAFAVQELQKLSTERMSAATGFRDKLATAIRVRVQFWTEHEVLYRLLLTIGREPRHRRQTTALLRSGQQFLLAIFREGVEAGELAESDYEPLAWAVLDMIRGATERRMDRVAHSSVDEDAEAITRFALDAAHAPA
jgi:AcrR family transcriptional regulator